MQPQSYEDILKYVMKLYPGCSYCEIYTAMTGVFQMSYTVKCWRDITCYLAGDPPKHIEAGFHMRNS
jgi:hypothetical protein